MYLGDMLQRSNFRRSKLAFFGDQIFCKIDLEIGKALGALGG
jgi:hypothetical protein